MWFFGLIVVLLIGAVAVVASGRWGAMNTAYDDRPDMTVPARQALTSTDIESARFAVGVRGYRMDEVDTLLERVAKEVAERDRRIADLERAVAPIVEAPDGHGFTSRPYDPAEFEDTGTQPPILVGGDFPVPDDSTDDPADDPTESPGSTGGTAAADGTANEAGSAGDADEPSGTAGAAGPAGSAHAPGDTDTADETSGTPSSAAGAADGPDGTAEAGGSEAGPTGSTHPSAGADGPDEASGTPRAAGTAGPGGAAYTEEAEDADEPETSELPVAGRAAADEYERLQAEARAVLEAQSQPVSPRRTSAPQQPAGESPSLTPAQRYDQLVQNQRSEQPAPSRSAPAEPEPDSQQAATHWTSQPPQQEQAGDTQATEETPYQQPADPQQEQGGETQATEQAQQQTPQQQGGVEAANGSAGDEEGWRFWPPADQAGEGAYRRPS